jgi:hypothetical protein
LKKQQEALSTQIDKFKKEDEEREQQMAEERAKRLDQLEKQNKEKEEFASEQEAKLH